MSLDQTSDVSLKPAIDRIGKDIDAKFAELLEPPHDARNRLYEAMRYAAIGGGKRLRPLLLTATAGMFSVSREAALHVATAVECIHIYSLIHDDLPCMDDDELRHGRPTVHRAFDEATAVLAGDALHALAFEILADERMVPEPFTRVELISALAHASGPQGMAGGQMMDLEAEKQRFDLPTITRLQQLKTGALIGVSVEMGAILGRVPADQRIHLRGYSRDLGLAYQIADDLLDATGDAERMGKAVGKDDAAGKQTFLTLMGHERAQEQARLLVEQAMDHLTHYGEAAAILRAVAQFVLNRDH